MSVVKGNRGTNTRDSWSDIFPISIILLVGGVFVLLGVLDLSVVIFMAIFFPIASVLFSVGEEDRGAPKRRPRRGERRGPEGKHRRNLK